MTHWRKPLYTIETEMGTLYSVNEEEARACAEYFDAAETPVKYQLRRQPTVPDWIYIAGMVLFVSVVIVGLAYLFRG